MANLKQESINQFEGFGNDYKLSRGECYRMSGFMKSQNGILANGYLYHLMNFSTLTDLGNDTSRSLAYARGFALSGQNPDNYLFAYSDNGCIIQSAEGQMIGNQAEYIHRTMGANSAYMNNLITDPKGRLLYHQDRYLGMFDGTGNTKNYTTGTVQVTNGSGAVVGTGTTFTAGMVGKAFKIIGDNKFYTVATYTDATHITINSYTGTGGSGKSYIINTQWTDTWKDFGADVTLPNNQSPKTPMDTYEDMVIFGRGNVITTLNTITDTVTTDASPSFNLPTGYSIDHIVSNSNGILIGANVRNRGVLVLWDILSDRSIAPWIWFPDNILSVCKQGSNWIVITTRSIYTTNGYSATEIVSGVLESSYYALISNNPKNTLVLENYLYFFGSASGRGIKRNVLYRMNLTNKLVEAFPRYTINQITSTCSQMEYVGESNRLYLALNGNTTENGVDWFITRGAPTCSSYLTSHIGQGANKKVAKRVKLRLKRNTPRHTTQIESFTFKVSVKISDTRHTMYRFAQTKITSADATHITINNGSGSFNTPNIGDEVEFVGDDGNDTNAGYARNVISITGAGTSTEVWTLDSAFPSIPQSGQNVTITPFQLVGRKTVTVTNGEIDELIFDVKNSIKSNVFMLKIDIEANSSGIELEMEEPIFIYEDLGVL